MYDIAIVGGGPAGSTLARLIGKQHKVLLLERRDFKRPLYSGIQKCCGGLIAPDAQKVLASFGLGIPKSVLISPQLFAVRTLDLPNSLEVFYQRHYINIDREEFDKWLQSLIPRSVDIVNGCLYLFHETRDGKIIIHYHKDGKRHEAVAGLLVGADGGFSKVRRTAFPNLPFPQTYVAIQEWFECAGYSNYYGAIFDEEITDFYSWTIPKDQYLILGAALRPNANVHRNFELLKHKLKNYGFDFTKSIRKNGIHVVRPTHSNQIWIGSGQVALIGEAAGFISPSSAEGFSYAFRSALALAKSLESGPVKWPETYRRNSVALMRNIYLKNLKSPFMYNHILRKLIMQTGVKGIRLECPAYKSNG
jgi:geranylgeranyl reductase